MPDRYRIGDLAREFGLTLRALRFYQDKGLLKPERRGTTRLYSEADRTRLGRIVRLASFGLPLTVVGQMLEMTERETLPILEEQVLHLQAEAERVAEARGALMTAISELRAAFA